MNGAAHKLPAARTPLPALAGAFLVALGLFLLIPLTQMLEPAPPPDLVLRQMAPIRMPLPPPPPPPPDPDPDPIEVAPAPPPDLPPGTAPSPPLAELSVSIFPEAGTLLAAATPSTTLTGLDIGTEQIRDGFDFAELDQPLQILYIPPFDYPADLQRRRILTGTVVVRVRIDPQGRSSLEEVVSSTHPLLTPVAESIADRARFSVTTMHGRPVSVLGDWPITLQAPR